MIARTKTITPVLKLNDFEVEKFILLKSIAFAWSIYPCKYAVNQHPIADKTKTIVILWIKGKSG